MLCLLLLLLLLRECLQTLLKVLNEDGSTKRQSTGEQQPPQVRESEATTRTTIPENMPACLPASRPANRPPNLT